MCLFIRGEKNSSPVKEKKCLLGKVATWRGKRVGGILRGRRQKNSEGAFLKKGGFRGPKSRASIKTIATEG